MKSDFFARRGLLILCVVFFLVPFGLRGARMSLERMENNVKDWLPDDFPETRELEWFGKHFIGERFVLATWAGCMLDAEQLCMVVRGVRKPGSRAVTSAYAGERASDQGLKIEFLTTIGARE